MMTTDENPPTDKGHEMLLTVLEKTVMWILSQGKTLSIKLLFLGTTMKVHNPHIARKIYHFFNKKF